MNKQELIDYCNVLKESKNRIINCIDVDGIIDKIKQLDEPKPVKVPQCVAEYINFQKKNNFHVYGAMRVIEDHYDKKVPEWFYRKNIEIFVRAWLDGYEIEKEKRYTVKIKGKIKENKLVYGWGVERYFFATSYDSSKRGKHTRKELEDADFGWVFDCEGVEVKELEDE